MKELLLQLRSRLAQAIFKQSTGAQAGQTLGTAPQSPRTPEDGLPGHAEDPAAAHIPGSLQTGLVGDALALSKQLAGQSFTLPDLRQAFAYWPLAKNKHIERLKRLVDDTLERVIRSKRKLAALKEADFALLIALWYPDAEWDELVIATNYSVWIFVWDDEVDAGDTDVSTHEELAHAYSKDSREFVLRELNLKPRTDDGDSLREPSSGSRDAAHHENMRLFVDVGRDLNKATDVVQRARFLRELENFMLHVGIEHSYRLDGSIPSVDKFLEIRSGSVGCAPQIALTDYMLRVRLPESVMESAAMKSLWAETVTTCLILNDIYSVQKEIAQGSFFNLVPVIFHSLKAGEQTLSEVTTRVMKLLLGSMEEFEAAATALVELTAGADEKVAEDTQAFIKWCRYFITGVLDWSLKSKRYGMAQCIESDGSLRIVL